MDSNRQSGSNYPLSLPPLSSSSSTLVNSDASRPIGFSTVMSEPNNQSTSSSYGSPFQLPYPTGPIQNPTLPFDHNHYPSKTLPRHPSQDQTPPPLQPNQNPYPQKDPSRFPMQDPLIAPHHPPQPSNQNAYPQKDLPRFPMQDPLVPPHHPPQPNQNPYPQKDLPRFPSQDQTSPPQPNQNPYPQKDLPRFPSQDQTPPPLQPNQNPYPQKDPLARFPTQDPLIPPHHPSQPSNQNAYPQKDLPCHPSQDQTSPPPQFNQNYVSEKNPHPFPKQDPVLVPSDLQKDPNRFQQPFTPQQQLNQNPGQQNDLSRFPTENSTGQQQKNLPPPSPPPASNTHGKNTNSSVSSAINDRIQQVANKYEIDKTAAQRLNILEQFEIVVLCDDSTSMNSPLGGTNGTRWDELRSIVKVIIEIGTIFDSNGVDIHFLNRPPRKNVTNVHQVVEEFFNLPNGLTPLTAALRQIFQSAATQLDKSKRLLVFVATDGAPCDPKGNIDIENFENLMRNERQTKTTCVTFIACTDDKPSVAYLNDWDRTMQNVDVVESYRAEREKILKVNGPNFSFTPGDYVVKALLGAVDRQIDLLDETPAAGGKNNAYWSV